MLVRTSPGTLQDWVIVGGSGVMDAAVVAVILGIEGRLQRRRGGC